MKIIPSIVTFLFLIAAGTVSSPAQNATTVEPLLVYKALQDKDCRHWVDSVMDKLSFKEKVGQLFIYTIAPVNTKRNLELLREVIDTYKVGGLLFSGGKMQNQVELTNRAQRQAKVPLMITFDGEWGLAMRLRGMPVFPRNMVLGCIRDNRLLYEYGREVARQCRQIGVQVNFAPVADVNINPENPVINTRLLEKIRYRWLIRLSLMLPVWKAEGFYLCANIFPDMEIPMLIRIRRFRYFLSLVSVWTVWNFILLKKPSVPDWAV